MDDELAYLRGSAEPKSIEDEAREIWVKLIETDEVEDRLRQAGVETPAAFPYEVKEADAGVVVTGTTIAIAILSPVAKDVLTDIWRKLILPRLQRRLGDDAVGREKSDGRNGKNDDA